MTTIIKDGTGTGNTVKVDDRNRAHSLVTTKTIREDAILRGELFAHNTDFINLTTDTESGIFYLKNDSDQDLFIDDLLFTEGKSDGIGEGKLSVDFAPSGGTLLSAQSSNKVINTNSASATTFNGLSYKGVQGSTVTGSPFGHDLMTTGSLTKFPPFNPSGLLSKGASVAISYTPPAGNTGMNVQLLIATYYITDSEK